MAKHIVFVNEVVGLIPVSFLGSNCWVQFPHSFPSHMVLPGVQEKVGCPLQAVCNVSHEQTIDCGATHTVFVHLQ